MTDFKHGLGDKVRDVIAGLTGVVTSRAEHLYGCARYWVSPQEMKDGKPIEGAWYDEDAIELVEASVITRKEYRVVAAAEPELPRLRAAGGPSSQPSSQSRVGR